MVCQLLLTMVLVFPNTDPVPDAAQDAAPPPPATVPDRWFLMQALQGTWYGSLLDSNGIQVYGWTEASYTTGFRSSLNLPSLSQSPTEQAQLNQNYVVIERPIATNGLTEPAFGFRSDTILPGTDAQFTHARGVLDGQSGRYQIDPYQLYGEVYFPNVVRGLDIKVGRVAAPYGMEVTPAPYNALFSHAYAYFYNPFTHTGIMSTLKLTDELALGAWFTLGNDVAFSPAARGMFVGVVQYASTDQIDSATFAVAVSPDRYDATNAFSNQDHVDLVVSHRLSPVLVYSLDVGTGFERDVPKIGVANWSWAVNYLTYTWSPRLCSTARLECFDDREGFKTGSPGLYSALTTGLEWKPYRSLLVRPEVRYDYNEQSRPFGGEHGQVTASIDAVVRW